MQESDELSSPNKHPHVSLFAFVAQRQTINHYLFLYFEKKKRDSCSGCKVALLRIRKLPLLLKCFQLTSLYLYLFQAYVYDIRSSAYLHKLQKFTETVLNVSFNPATPEVRILFSAKSFWCDKLSHQHRMCEVYRLNGCLSTFTCHSCHKNNAQVSLLASHFTTLHYRGDKFYSK